MTNNNKKYTPELRFLECTENWIEKKLGEITTNEDNKRRPISKILRKKGKYPYFGANGIQDYVSDYIFDGEYLLVGEDGSVLTKENTPVINWASGRFWVNNHAHVLSQKNGISLKLISYILSTIKIEGRVTGIPPKLNQDNLYTILIPIPSSSMEQKKIADCLSSLDTYIDTTKRKLELLKEYKKGLMQQLFPAPGKNIPELRFPEFRKASAWGYQALGAMGDTYGGLSGKSAEDFGYGKPYVTYKQVFSSLEIDFSHCLQVRITTNEKQNKLQYGDILVTMSSETPEEVGYTAVVATKDIPECYLNSFCFIYRLFEEQDVDINFLIYLFNSDVYRKNVVRIAQGITRFNISKTKFKEIALPIPNSKDEQRKIAKVLSSVDYQLTYYTKKIHSLELHKKGLMQRLFPQL